MNINSDNILLIGSLLLLISILAGKISGRFAVPTLLFFLLVGILAGSEGIGGINFNNAPIAQFVGIVALNFILFSGGLDTHWQSIRPVLWRGVALSTVGVFITALAVGLFVHYVLNFTLLEGLLLGSIVSCTDAAAVFSILRSKGIGLKNSLQPVLELESGSNDPMSYFLTITFTTLLANSDFKVAQLIPMLLQQFVLGGAIGYLMGRVSTWTLNRIQLDYDGLYAVLILSLTLFTYSATHAIGGNGFLAVYLSAVILGNSSFIHKRSMIRFYEGQAWLMQIILFLTLGLLVFPSQVWAVAGYGVLISLFLIFVARPLGVFGSLAFFRTNVRSKLFLSWVGLRGAVPIVFATYPMIAGLAKSNMIFNLVFFISVSSVLLQGTTLSYVAKLLRVVLPDKVKKKDLSGFAHSDKVKGMMKELPVTETSFAAGKRIVELNIPYTIHIMAIRRGDHYIQPIGSTRISAGDRLYLLADDEQALEPVLQLLGPDQKT
jgi:cell volume regulation protein A